MRKSEYKKYEQYKKTVTEEYEGALQELMLYTTVIEAINTVEKENSFVPDAITNPDQEYAKSNEQSLSHLTDEVFNPDRFDDDNGVSTKIDPPIISSNIHAEIMQNSVIDPFAEEATPTNESDHEQDKVISSNEEGAESVGDFTKRL